MTSAIYFEPLQLALTSRPLPAPTAAAAANSFLFESLPGGPLQLAATLNATEPYQSYVYIPSATIATLTDKSCSASMLECVLHQWHSAVQRFPCARAALESASVSACPFLPLQTALASIHAQASFAAVLALPSWQLQIVMDFLCAYAREMMPMLIADELLPLRSNLCAVKLLQDGNLLATTPVFVVDILSPLQPKQFLPERRTMEELVVMEQQLFSQNVAWEFNVTPKSMLCKDSTERTIVVVADSTQSQFHCVVINEPGTVYIPALSTVFVWPPALEKNITSGISIAVDGSTLKELDVACFLDGDKLDSRVTQLDMIVVDCSGSMGSSAFPNDDDMKRSDAAQILFNMAVDKHKSMEIPSRVGCILFGSTIKIACELTDDLSRFEILLGQAGSDMGGTNLWMALQTAVHSLVAEKTRLLLLGQLHPAAKLRVIAVTDGQDSTHGNPISHADVAWLCRTETVLLDAFMLGNESDHEIRQCAHATGGHTLAFRDLRDASELFEEPFVVNLAVRTINESLPGREQFQSFADLSLYPRITATSARDALAVSVRAAESSSSAGNPSPGGNPSPSLNSKAMSFSQGSNTGALRRLARELQIIQTQAVHEKLRCIAVDAATPLELLLLVQGQATSVYRDSYLTVRVKASPSYPFKAPSISFAQLLFHPQIAGERLCDGGGHWNPASKISDAVAALLTSLDAPDISLALNSWASSLYTSDRPAYDAEVAKTLSGLTEANARLLGSAWLELPLVVLDTSVQVDPATPSVQVPSVQVDPAIPSVQVDPAIPSVQVDPAIPSVQVDPAVPSV